MTVDEWDREWQDMPRAPVEAHIEMVGDRTVVVHGGPVTSIPNRVGEQLDEVLYERGEPQAKETN